MNNIVEISEKEIDEKVKFLSSAKCNHTQHMYIDITGDLVQGTLLARIMYWFSADKNKKSKVRIFKDDYFWIAKQRKDWWEEIRITERQYDKAIKELEKKGFVILAKYKFNSMPTIHIRPDYENINSATNEWENRLRKEIILECESELQNEAYGNNTKCNSQGTDTKCKTGVTQEDNLLTFITNTNYSNNDYSSENTDKYALEDVKRPSSKGDMYASVPEEQEASAPKKQSRYIPKDYTEEQLREHIKPVVKSEVKQYIEDMEVKFPDDRAKTFSDILCLFCCQYEERFGENHYVMPDATIKSAVRRYLEPPEEMDGIFDFESYKELIDKYFSTDFNRIGKFKDENGKKKKVVLSFPHFMSDTIRGNLANRLWK